MMKNKFKSMINNNNISKNKKKWIKNFKILWVIKIKIKNLKN